jgi:predicted RNase H-like nuclease (RuvC/YqgF family)
VDPAVTAALVVVGGTAAGGVTGWLTSRKARNANVELTQKQTDDLESQIAERVIRMQEGERHKLAQRITELEAEVAQLKARAAQREQELQRDLQLARGEVERLRAEVGSLQTQLAAKEIELATARQEAASLHALVLTQTPPPAVAA